MTASQNDSAQLICLLLFLMSNMKDFKYIPIKDCKDGYLYRINSRNLSLGVYRAETKDFLGIRTKFGDRYLFAEDHYDLGEPHGTVKPKEEICASPVAVNYEKELFDFIDSMLKEIPDDRFDDLD
jgi:hypothetical protein